MEGMITKLKIEWYPMLRQTHSSTDQLDNMDYANKSENDTTRRRDGMGYVYTDICTIPSSNIDPTK